MDIDENINARFVKGKQKREKLACCYCKARYTGAEVNDFTASGNGKKQKMNIPLCPNCFVTYRRGIG